MNQWLTGIVGENAAPTVGMILLVIAVVLALLIVFWVLKRLTAGTFISGGRNRVARLSVMDAAAVDNRRRLVLIRRDDVEHLVLIGGPTDVVVETNIRQTEKAAPRRNEPAISPALSATVAAPPLAAAPEPQVVVDEPPVVVAPAPAPIQAPGPAPIIAKPAAAPLPPRAPVVPAPPPPPAQPRPSSPYQAAPRPPMNQPPLRPVEAPVAQRPAAAPHVLGQIAGGAGLIGAAALQTAQDAERPAAPPVVSAPPVAPAAAPRVQEPQFDISTANVSSSLDDVHASRSFAEEREPHIDLSEPDFTPDLSIDDDFELDSELQETLSGDLDISPAQTEAPADDKLEDEMERLLDELSAPAKR